VNVRVTPFGDSAVLLDLDDVRTAHRMAAAIDRGRRTGRAPAGIGETVVGMGNVVVHLDGPTAAGDVIGPWLQELAAGLDRSDALGSEPFDDSGPAGGSPPGQRRVDIPVTFDGPDLDEVAERIGVTPARVVELLTGAELEVAFLGFAPGFAYLTGLPPALAAVPRRPTPRVSVPGGSVAVAGGFASIYPSTGPGGWQLIGRTPTRLFDPDRPPHALLRPGDVVRFIDQPPAAIALADQTFAEPATEGGLEPLPDQVVPARRTPLTARSDRFAEVLEPGLLSLLQDAGRPGVSTLGIPRAGPADRTTMRLANRLVGNTDGDAVIEMTASGPRLVFTGQAHLAVLVPPGAQVDVLIDDHPVATGSVFPVSDGQVVTVGRIHGGLRAYLAVSGGFETDMVVGSRSSDLLSGLGPGPLVAGDRLDLGPPRRPHGLLLPPPETSLPHRSRPTTSIRTIRVVPGPHSLPAAGDGPLVAGPCIVGPASNRIGVRLSPRDHPSPNDPAGSAAGRSPGQIPSTGMVTGAIQLPPDGHPIILLPDHATVGGYPVVACVIAADLPLVGQLQPGETVEFVTVDLPTAHALLASTERALEARVTGWFPTEAGT
jgi:KipI family sensor histidine kinase inhibitor